VANGSESASGQGVFPREPSTQRIVPPRVRVCQQVRHGVDTSATVRLVDLAADIEGRIVDVSLGGCHIRTQRRFPVGIFRRVEVQFSLDGLPFRLSGVTQAVYDPFNIGIRFLDLSDRRREQLMQLIDDIAKSAQDSPPDFDPASGPLPPS
jgi:hypothetical protein